MLQDLRDHYRIAGLRSATLAIVAAVSLTTALSGCNGGGSGESAKVVTNTETPTSGAAPAAKAQAGAATGSDKYSVTVGISSSSGKVGAVQFNVKTTSSGGFVGQRDKVACSNVSGAAMLACNNKGEPGLSCAAIDPEGIATPVGLVRCDFLVDGSLAASDFSVEVVDASNPAMEAVEVEISVTEVAKAD
jgi:hypothetical protein